MTKTDKPIMAYKAFDDDMKCRGFQYKVGETYEHEGPVSECESGFHACEDPFDVFRFYDITTSKFAAVELSGYIDKGDMKIAAGKIKISAELELPEYIDHCVKWLFSLVKVKNGNYAKQASSGYSAKQASSGNYATQASSGNYAKQASSGNYAKQASSGYSATQASSGNYATQASSGNYAKQASSGYSATQASSGNSATQASSGNYAKQASSGYSAKQASSGNSATHKITGENGVISAAGSSAVASGADGTWISLAEYSKGECIGFATGCIGTGGLKADTFYKAKGGKLVEAK